MKSVLFPFLCILVLAAQATQGAEKPVSPKPPVSLVASDSSVFSVVAKDSTDPGSQAPASAKASDFTGPPEKNWGWPVVEILAANAGISAYNILVSQHGFAKISFQTISNNLRGGWVWDYDLFTINQFSHPYQGHLYYSAARHFGHDYYTSMGYTALGSVQWEYIMERETPSYNDFITTTLGGAMLGEVSFRVAESILDERTTGTERVFREMTAAFVNPVHGFNRILSGETFSRQSRLSTHRTVSEGMLLRVSTGGTVAFASTADDGDDNPLQRVPKANNELLILYGDEYTAQKPYDYFILNMGVNVYRDPVATISARAQVFKLDLYGTEHGRGIFMVGQNFDYLNNGIYKLGASGFGGGYSHIFGWGNGWFHSYHGQIGGIAVGGVSTEYFQEDARNYNLGPGAFGTTRILVGKIGWGHTALVLDRYWLHSRSGARGDEFIGSGFVEVSKSLYRTFGAMVTYSFYDRTAHYRDFSNRTETAQEIKLLLNYTLK